ncbi:MAG: hypothetical protein V7723_09485 [Sneathiella sp.]|uniref:hypothetical protein n=1 Tax=Sneathiella sp. TaxID=1964365 RepID=UPI0030015BA8
MIEDDKEQTLPIDLDLDLDEVVDLDALFDALNIAAEDGADTMEFKALENGGGVLTVFGQGIDINAMPSGLDDLNDQSDDLLKTNIISDES